MGQQAKIFANSNSTTTMSSKSHLSYSDRARQHPNALAKKLFAIAESKKTNVTVSADVTTTKELLVLAAHFAHSTLMIPLTSINYLNSKQSSALHCMLQNAYRHNLRLQLRNHI
jgi:orotidine-5'-phosphate decarboxylase